jgi:hypothetical protein
MRAVRSYVLDRNENSWGGFLVDLNVRELVPLFERMHFKAKVTSYPDDPATVDAETAALILRHADSTTTRRHYIKLQAGREGAAAMKRLEKTLLGQQTGSNKKRSK